MDQIRDVVTLDVLDDEAQAAQEGVSPVAMRHAGEAGPQGGAPVEESTGHATAGLAGAAVPAGEGLAAGARAASAPSVDGAARCPVAEGLAARRLQSLGSGARFADELHGLLMRTPLFAGLGHTESRLLGAVMHVYAAHAGQTLITEGDSGDYMMLVMDGQVDVVRRDEHNFPVRIAVARPGQTLGEMSMVDGQRRFASCVAQAECRVAVLTRAALLALLTREPVLGNKVLLKLVSLLSDRLRETSAHLVNCLGRAA